MRIGASASPAGRELLLEVGPGGPPYTRILPHGTAPLSPITVIQRLRGCWASLSHRLWYSGVGRGGSRIGGTRNPERGSGQSLNGGEKGEQEEGEERVERGIDMMMLSPVTLAMERNDAAANGGILWEGSEEDWSYGEGDEEYDPLVLLGAGATLRERKRMGKKGSMLGASLIFSGTAVGAGMIALPAEMAGAGWAPSQTTLLLAWIFTYISSMLVLELSWIFAEGGQPAGFYSVAGETLGSWGQAAIALLFWFLLTCLTVAYTAGGGGQVTPSPQQPRGTPRPQGMGPAWAHEMDHVQSFCLLCEIFAASHCPACIIHSPLLCARWTGGGSDRKVRLPLTRRPRTEQVQQLAASSGVPDASFLACTTIYLVAFAAIGVVGTKAVSASPNPQCPLAPSHSSLPPPAGGLCQQDLCLRAVDRPRRPPWRRLAAG